jgi:hypothetical protein
VREAAPGGRSMSRSRSGRASTIWTGPVAASGMDRLDGVGAWSRSASGAHPTAGPGCTRLLRRWSHPVDPKLACPAGSSLQTSVSCGATRWSSGRTCLIRKPDTVAMRAPRGASPRTDAGSVSWNRCRVHRSARPARAPWLGDALRDMSGRSRARFAWPARAAPPHQILPTPSVALLVQLHLGLRREAQQGPLLRPVHRQAGVE